MSTSALERRLEALEATGDGGGCERCSGVLVVVSNVMTGEFHSASWRGEALSEEEDARASDRDELLAVRKEARARRGAGDKGRRAPPLFRIVYQWPDSLACNSMTAF